MNIDEQNVPVAGRVTFGNMSRVGYLGYKVDLFTAS